MLSIILATLAVVFSAVSDFLQVRLYSTFYASLSQLFPFLTIIIWHRHSSDKAKLYEDFTVCRCKRNIYENDNYQNRSSVEKSQHHEIQPEMRSIQSHLSSYVLCQYMGNEVFDINKEKKRKATDSRAKLDNYYVIP